MTAPSNRLGTDLRGHEYVTGRASPQMASDYESSRLSSASALAREAVSVVSSGVEDVLGGIVQTVKRHPVATLCLGLCLGLVLTAVYRGAQE